jgi:hypothetical protein
LAGVRLRGHACGELDTGGLENRERSSLSRAPPLAFGILALDPLSASDGHPLLAFPIFRDGL